MLLKQLSGHGFQAASVWTSCICGKLYLERPEKSPLQCSCFQPQPILACHSSSTAYPLDVHISFTVVVQTSGAKKGFTVCHITVTGPVVSHFRALYSPSLTCLFITLYPIYFSISTILLHTICIRKAWHSLVRFRHKNNLFSIGEIMVWLEQLLVEETSWFGLK